MYLRPKQLRQRINCLAMQFLMRIGPAVPLRIIRFFLQTEIRAEINKGTSFSAHCAANSCEIPCCTQAKITSLFSIASCAEQQGRSHSP